MTRKALWVLFVLLALGIGFYPATYFFRDRSSGLLSTKSSELLSSTYWNIAFYTHIIFGGIALLTGWSQFSVKLRTRNLALHRRLGKIYVIVVMLSSIAGLNIALFATGGWVPSLGFIGLGLTWFFTTLLAYTTIRKKQIDQHRELMVYSYAACFAAVTLRIWLPLLIMIFGNFLTAYFIVAWLCWVPNMFVAYFIARRLATQKI